MKILACKLRVIGDTALWTSALGALKLAHPKAQIEVLTFPVGKELLLHYPGLSKVHAINPSSFALTLKTLSLLPQEYDYLLGFHATTSLCRLSRWIRAKEKILHHHSWKSNPIVNTRFIPQAGHLEHTIQRDYRVLEAMGISLPIQSTQLYVSEEEKQWAKNALHPHTSIAALLPGAQDIFRQYPEPFWKDAVRRLTSKSQLHWIVLANENMSASWRLREFCEKMGMTLFDSLSLRQVMALLSQCQTAAGNDSGLTHVAQALGLKTVTVFGPGSYGDFAPANKTLGKTLRAEVPCRTLGPRDNPDFQYCTWKECDHLSCLKKITPEAMADAILGLEAHGAPLA